MSQGISFPSVVPICPAGDDPVLSDGTVPVTAILMAYDGASYKRIHVSAAGEIKVENTELPVPVTLSDTLSNVDMTRVASVLLLYNGTTGQWSRARVAENGLNTTGPGIPVHAVMAQLDDSSPTAITENNFGALRMTPGRELRVQPKFATRADVFTGTTNGTTVDCSAAPCRDFSLQVLKSGAVTVWDMRLEGSNDGTNFTQIVAHTNTDGDGATKFSSGFPVLYFRSRCAGITGGTNLTATILGMA